MIGEQPCGVTRSCHPCATDDLILSLAASGHDVESDEHDHAVSNGPDEHITQRLEDRGAERGWDVWNSLDADSLASVLWC